MIEAQSERVRLMLLAALTGEALPEPDTSDRALLLSMLPHSHRLWWPALVDAPRKALYAAAFRFSSWTLPELTELYRLSRSRLSLSERLSAVLTVASPLRDAFAADVLFRELSIRDRAWLESVSAALNHGGERTFSTAVAMLFALPRESQSLTVRMCALLTDLPQHLRDVFLTLVSDYLRSGRRDEVPLQSFLSLLETAALLEEVEGYSEGSVLEYLFPGYVHTSAAS